MNPWTDSFEEYRQTVIGEANKKGYKKSAERWQDDDCDGKWYEKSDTDGKISKREKKEKAKHYKEDMSKDKEGHTTGGFRISNKEANAAKGRLKDKVAKKREQISTLKKEEVVDEGLLDNLKAKVNKKLATAGRNFKGGSVSQMGNYAEKSLNSEEAVDEGKKKGLDGKACWDGYKLSGTKKKGGKTVDNCVKEDEIINNIDGTTTEIIDVIKAPKMVAAPKFSNWREDFVWDEPVDEALKTPKLDIDAEKGKVKNKIEVNPTVETEAYDNTKSPDYKKKKKALAKKHGGAKNIKGHPQYEHHQKDENGNEIPHEQLDEIDGSKLGIGLAAGVVGGGMKLMHSAKKAAERMRKKRTDAMKQYEEVEKKNLNEGKVKYYSGQDRDKNTGLPKGLKSSPVRTEKEVNKKLDRTTLAQSYEPEGEVLSDGYQRNPERDTRSARQRRMDDPDRGINSQAFRDFMAAQQSKPKKKKKEVQKESIEAMAKLQSGMKKQFGLKANPYNDAKIQAANNAILAKHRMGTDDIGGSMTMTRDGQNINFGEFGGSLVNQITKKATGAVDTATSMATDPKYTAALTKAGTNADEIRKGAGEVKSTIQRGGDEAEFNIRRGINQYIPGTFSHQAVGVEKDIQFNTAKAKAAANKNKGGFKLGVNSYEPKGDVIDELNRYEKETGESSGSMNMPKGRKTKKGGTSSPVMRAVRTSIRKETGKPHGQQKKTKGEKGNRQPGDRRTTPADTIAKRRQSKKDADAAMRDTRGT